MLKKNERKPALSTRQSESKSKISTTPRTNHFSILPAQIKSDGLPHNFDVNIFLVSYFKLEYAFYFLVLCAFQEL